MTNPQKLRIAYRTRYSVAFFFNEGNNKEIKLTSVGGWAARDQHINNQTFVPPTNVCLQQE
jgi:hypothetical protein